MRPERLVIDPALEGELEQRAGVVAVGVHHVVGLARHPGRLRELLRGTRYESVTLIDDPVGGGLFHALALGAAGAARTAGFEFREPGGSRPLSRTRVIGKAAARAATALVTELASMPRLRRRAASALAAGTALPAHVADPRRVVYLRAEPSLRWRGAYVGGAATHTTGVIRGFASNGLAVTVAAPERPAGTESVEHVELPRVRPNDLVPWLPSVELSECVRDSVPGPADFVYQRYSMGSYAGLALARELGVPLVLEYNGSEVWTQRNWRGGRFWLSDVAELIETRNLGDASLVVVVSDALADEVLARGVPKERVLVNPNGVDVEALAEYRQGAPEEWRRRVGLPEAPTVGFVGTFSSWHGVALLPELIASVAAEVPETRWTLVGAGPLWEQVNAEIQASDYSDRVHMPGLVAHDDALRLLAGADVFVSPHVPNEDGSRFFGSPTKLFEYMGLARPIVASDLEQIGQVIDHERTGLLCPPGDVAAAADATVRLLRDAPLRTRLAAGALARADAEYGWNAHTERILDSLRSAAP